MQSAALLGKTLVVAILLLLLAASGEINSRHC